MVLGVPQGMPLLGHVLQSGNHLMHMFELYSVGGAVFLHVHTLCTCTCIHCVHVHVHLHVSMIPIYDNIMMDWRTLSKEAVPILLGNCALECSGHMCLCVFTLKAWPGGVRACSAPTACFKASALI